MVKLNKIYTRTGDDGTTGLGTGERVAKDSVRVQAYGTVDEANAAIGMARIHLTSADAKIDAMLASIQNDLFDLGADLCVPDRGDAKARPVLRITQTQVDRLETEIDAMNTELSPLRSFVLPGGCPAAAQLHVARTISRRAEREMIRLASEPGEDIGESALKYVNRLSDFLFVASRYVNDKGAADVLWVPGKHGG